MPNYDFKNTETGEIIEVCMSIHDLDKYKEENPHMERYFEDVMSKIQAAHPKANLSRFT